MRAKEEPVRPDRIKTQEKPGALGLDTLSYEEARARLAWKYAGIALGEP